MKRLAISIAAAAAALGLAACGSSGGGTTSTGSASGSASAGASAKTVSVRQVSGIGRVLVDSSGMALYTPDGNPPCTGACTSFWKPLAPGGATPSAATGVGKLSVVKRSDGSKQVATKGKPLYTFTEDSPGNLKGNGFSDKFGGRQFTWHVVRSGGATASTAAGGGGSSAPSNSGGGYGY